MSSGSTRAEGDIKSYVARKLEMGRGFGVVSSTFLPGYTPAHQPTPQKAIEYKTEKLMREIHERFEEIKVYDELLGAMNDDGSEITTEKGEE